MKIFLGSVLLLMVGLGKVYCQHTEDVSYLTIENKGVSRMFKISSDSGFFTKTFINKATGRNYANPKTQEFNITINDSLINGYNCRYVRHSVKDSADVKILDVTLRSPLPNVLIQLTYEIYADLPVVRKQLKVVNKGTSDLVLTNPDVESMDFQVVDKYLNEVYCSYGSNLTRIPYKGDFNDAAVMLYNLSAGQGAILGNEAPGVLKNTEIYTNVHGRIQIGMRHIDEAYPFKANLVPGDVFASPRAFIYVFSALKWQDGFEGGYKDFVRKYLGVSMYARRQAPLFLYDTWRPFEDTLDEKLVRESADKLSGTGTDMYIIDAGWYKYSGDFIPDSAKFPHGLKATCDYIRSKGMQVGIWFPIACVNAKSRIAREHPDWLMKDMKGLPANVHNKAVYVDGFGWGDALKTMSLGSPYYNHIKNAVAGFVKELGATYVKLDLAMVTSAYIHQPDLTGDFEANPSKLYRDHASSYWVIYQRCMQLMDELHAAFPGLLIDCTFETWGKHNIVDYALIEHADYDWVANLEFQRPIGAISIRQMTYDRARVIPNSTLLIGCQYMEHPNYPYTYFSLAAGNLVMLGDPRKLTAEQGKFYARWNKYFKEMEEKYQYSRFFQLYDVFDRPTDNNWDGCYRINTEKQGGLMFFYRNNSSDERRTFKVPCLRPAFRYKVYSFETGKTLGVFSGKTLMEKGVTVNIPTPYTAQVLTIEKE